ncbi:MAG TPA: AzlC family ABC transporter permease [Arenibaculum sp.]|nr:AzlC family ABC transporter permease [Arenibaculum sp.]
MHGAVLAGARMGLPIALSFFVFGITYGVAATDRGLSPILAVGGSAGVFSGSTQFMLLDMLNTAGSLFGVAFAVVLLNVRHLMMGAALLPALRGQPAGLQALGLLLMIDETWAIAMAADDRARLKVLIGSGIVAILGWCAGTGTGALIGAVVEDPTALGMDFVYYAVFLFILTTLWRTRETAVPWLVALAVAILVQKYVPGKWYVVAGGIAGALVAGCLPWNEKQR